MHLPCNVRLGVICISSGVILLQLFFFYFFSFIFLLFCFILFFFDIFYFFLFFAYTFYHPLFFVLEFLYVTVPSAQVVILEGTLSAVPSKVCFSVLVVVEVVCFNIFSRTKQENMDAQLDYEDKELEQWSQLSAAFRLPSVMAMMRSVPILGRWVATAFTYCFAIQRILFPPSWTGLGWVGFQGGVGCIDIFLSVFCFIFIFWFGVLDFFRWASFLRCFLGPMILQKQVCIAKFFSCAFFSLFLFLSFLFSCLWLGLAWLVFCLPGLARSA